MDNKVIEIARRVATTGVFTSKAESVRYAAEAEESKIGMFADGGMYCFAIGGRYPQRIYSALVYELKKSYNTGVHRVFYDENGVLLVYMPLRKKMRRHGHGSPVPPPSTDVVFIGNGNAQLFESEGDLQWSEEQKVLTAGVFVKSTAYDKIAQVVMEIDGTQNSVIELAKTTIAELKAEKPSVVIPQGFGDSDYCVIYIESNVEDITEGDKARVVLIDAEGEDFAQTNEKKIHIVPVQE